MLKIHTVEIHTNMSAAGAKQKLDVNLQCTQFSGKKSAKRFPSCCSGTNNEHSFPLTFMPGEPRVHVNFFLKKQHVEEGDYVLGFQDWDAHCG